MSKPIIKFKQEPPININCQEATEVVLVVAPNAPGPCKVILSTLLQSCTFQNGESEITLVVDTSSEESSGAETTDDGSTEANPSEEVSTDVESTEVECTFHVQMSCDQPDEYFTLLMAKAINSEEETSFRKPIEAIIKCGPTV